MDYWPLIITYHLYMRWKLNKLNKFFCPFHWRSTRLFTSPPWSNPVIIESPATAGSCVQNCGEVGTRRRGNRCLCPGAPISFRYLFAIHQGLTTSTGWKEIAPQCHWDGTGGDRLKIHAGVFNTEAGKRTFPQEYTIFRCRRGINKTLHLRDV